MVCTLKEATVSSQEELGNREMLIEKGTIEVAIERWKGINKQKRAI